MCEDLLLSREFGFAVAEEDRTRADCQRQRPIARFVCATLAIYVQLKGFSGILRLIPSRWRLAREDVVGAVVSLSRSQLVSRACFVR